MNKAAFIFSGYDRNLVFSSDAILNYDDYKKRASNILRYIGNNLECVDIFQEELEKERSIEQCTLALNIALANFLVMKGVEPDYLMGFSVGILHALSCAGSISLECAMKILNYRENIIKGDKGLKISSMLLIEGIDYSLVEILISKYMSASPISYNTNRSITVLMQDKFKEEIFHNIKYVGGRVTQLNKNLFYSLPFINLKNTELSIYLSNYGYTNPEITTYVNSSLFNANKTASLNICTALTQPIIFIEEIKNLVDMGVDLFIEIGGRGLLQDNIKNLAPNVNVYSVNDLESAEYVAQKLLMHA